MNLEVPGSIDNDLVLEHLKFSVDNETNDINGSLKALTDVMTILFKYYSIDTKVMSINVSVVSAPCKQDEDDEKYAIGRTTSELIKHMISADASDTDQQTSDDDVMDANTGMHFRISVNKILREITAIKHISEEDNLQLRCVLTKEYNRRMYGPGCQKRTKGQWKTWINTVTELTELLKDNIITADLYINRIKAEE